MSKEKKHIEIVMSFDQLSTELGFEDCFKARHVYQGADDSKNEKFRILIECPDEAPQNLSFSQIKRKTTKMDFSFLDGMSLRQLEIIKRAVELREELRKLDNRNLQIAKNLV